MPVYLFIKSWIILTFFFYCISLGAQADDVFIYIMMMNTEMKSLLVRINDYFKTK